MPGKVPPGTTTDDVMFILHTGYQVVDHFREGHPGGGMNVTKEKLIRKFNLPEKQCAEFSDWNRMSLGERITCAKEAARKGIHFLDVRWNDGPKKFEFMKQEPSSQPATTTKLKNRKRKLRP